ncbi:MAG: heme-dependent oxidative N-demethylase family protein [Acidimicrobiales bacterium]
MSASFPYVPLDPRGWRLAMGLRPLDLAKWLEFDDLCDEELLLKARLIESDFGAVVATNPEGDEASVELLGELKRFMRDVHPERSTETDASEHPVVQASRLVQEDLCVLVKEDTWRLRAACVCFPSRWDLASKIGTTLDDIHSPVPLYDQELSRPTNAFFDRLTPEKSFWRLNWTLLDSAVLHQRTSSRHALGGDLSEWFFRVERQTLRQLPRTRATVFTIRTYVTSAATLRDNDPEFVPALLHALDTAPAPVQRYKGWTGVATRLRDAL